MTAKPRLPRLSRRQVDPSWDMPLRTRVLVRALRRRSVPISDLTLEEIPAVRALVTPTHAPYSWITGPVFSDVEITDRSFTARDGEQVPVRVYHPTLPGADPSVPRPVALPAVVWFHGGGWVLGSTRAHDPLCSFLAHEAGVIVVNVDYRLAPEHRAPQAVLDCVDALRWVASAAADLGVRPDRLGVAGDSAGGNLATVVARVIRDEGGADIGHQSLLYPGVDATMSHPSVAEHANGAIITRADLDAFIAHYLGADGALDRQHPLVSPLHAEDLSGLPPALIQTADLDPLRDEGRAYAEALRTAGVEVQLTNYPRAPHGFMSFPGATKVGRAARQELALWIARHAR